MASFSICMSKHFIPCQCDLLYFFFPFQYMCATFIHQEGLVMSSGLPTGESGNKLQQKQHGSWQFLHSQRWIVLSKYLLYFQSMHRMPGCARWRPSWVIIEKTRTVWRNITCHLSTHNRITSSPRDSQMRHRATFERPKTNLGETGKPILW